MHENLSLQEIQQKWHGTLKSYIIGFFVSLILTGASFSLVITGVFAGPTLVYTIVGLALVQAIVQLLFFMHMGHEDKPRWETGVFLFMVMILLIIVVGSLWIMYDLNDRVMSHMTMGIPS